MKLTTFVCICAVWSEHTLESVPAGEENEGFLCLCLRTDMESLKRKSERQAGDFGLQAGTTSVPNSQTFGLKLDYTPSFPGSLLVVILRRI